MTNYREILRLKSLGFNNRQIADNSGATRQTIPDSRKCLANSPSPSPKEAIES
ncbi:MAG: hypothetical protein VB120_05925 [Lachnospiraceae bacterium]|nr:hypothetical protein [Lachnospiraceae bacterium]